MLGAYASFLVVLGAAALVGQAILAACGRRGWSGLAPAVGLAALCALAWWTVRLPGEGTAALIAIALAAGGSALLLRGRPTGARATLGREGVVALAALIAASLPFIVEARFGILGTGLNPDMSQHLFAADRLASGGGERLIADGYPLGPHAIVVAVAALGPSTVAAFNGLMLAVAVAACLAPLALLDGLTGWRRVGAALCIGLAYLVAAYHVQGAFKETMQALFVLAFAIALWRLARPAPDAAGAAPGRLGAVPLAVLAIGSAYVYSFPGLAWLAGALAVWALVELGRAAGAGGVGRRWGAIRPAAGPALIALAVLAVALAPEFGRMAEFASFETFDPSGPGLGNLFDRLSPLEALGIWPSGDFRVEPGDGFAPAPLFYLGAAFGLAALAAGLAWWLRAGERAVPAALGAAALLWLLSLLAGTPYQEAKALVVAVPLVALVAARTLAIAAPAALAATFLLAAGGSSLLALVNGPVGPRGYSPELAELRPGLGPGSTLVLAPPELLDDQHGTDYLLWELRGNRICVEPLAAPARRPAPGVSTLVVAVDASGAVVPEAVDRAGAGAGPGPCPLIPDAARADPSAAGAGS
jgi:hypothetical protein